MRFANLVYIMLCRNLHQIDKPYQVRLLSLLQKLVVKQGFDIGLRDGCSEHVDGFVRPTIGMRQANGRRFRFVLVHQLHHQTTERLYEFPAITISSAAFDIGDFDFACRIHQDIRSGQLLVDQVVL